MILMLSALLLSATPEGCATALEKLRSSFDLGETGKAIVVDVSDQRLFLFEGNKVVARYAVSTSRFGLGNKSGSNKTPLGTHRVRSKHGKDAKIGAVFKARRKTGKVVTIHTDKTDVEEDLITTRILWLEGLEPGVNKGRGIDSYLRYIYIHGTSEEGLIGSPASHGCVRMRNRDVVDLFSKVPLGTLVEIQE